MQLRYLKTITYEKQFFADRPGARGSPGHYGTVPKETIVLQYLDNILSDWVDVPTQVKEIPYKEEK